MIDVTIIIKKQPVYFYVLFLKSFLLSPIRTSVTARDAMKKFVGWRICRSTTKLTKTRRLPNVVMTMQIARLIAMTMVNIVLKGAGQHSGPQGVETVDVAGKKIICITLYFFSLQTP